MNRVDLTVQTIFTASILGALIIVGQLQGSKTSLYLYLGMVATGWALLNVAIYSRRSREKQPSFKEILVERWGTWHGISQWLGIVFITMGLIALFMAWLGNPFPIDNFLGVLVGFLLILPIMLIVIKLVQHGS